MSSGRRDLAARLGLGLAVLLAVGLLAHALVGDSGPLTVAAHATVGWWWIGGVVAVGLTAVGGSRRGRAFAAVVLALTIATVGLSVRGARKGADGPAWTVASANVLSTNPQVDGLLEDLARNKPDVVVLLEVRDSHGPLIDRHFPPADWPARVVIPRDDNFGVAWLGPAGSAPREVSGRGVPWVLGTAGADGPEVLGVHTLPPVSAEYHAVWTQQLVDLAELSGDRIVVGDLNATRHNPRFTDLEAVGFRDAFAQVGRPAVRTWTPFAGPDLLRLDHVLVRGPWRVLDARALPRQGSDHRAVVARIAR